MIAVHLEAGHVSIVKRPKPRRREGFALLRLLAGGICNTDLELRRGYYGFRGTPGHEFVAEVVECDTPSLRGKRVVGEINLNCGACEWCAGGLGRHCPTRTVLGIVRHPGAFRELIDLPERNLHVLPDSIPTEHAVFVEPLAAACEILDQVRIPKGREVAVLGDGKLGLLIAQVLHAQGAKVHHYGRHREKLALSSTAGIATEVTTTLPHGRYEFAVDATGSAEGLSQAASLLRPRGTLILKSTVHGHVRIDTAPVIVNEITLVGSRCGRFEPAIRLLRTGKVKVDRMISERFRLPEAAAAFERASQRGVLKVLLAGE
ncbi:MAG: alcohol dehydrogenase catalytic domain-containing protein [Bryobacteraceae bacterium]|nr:alcohol dehydrogenase catalytic domain-containing protein [Bryobacteraceae bacterium]